MELTNLRGSEMRVKKKQNSLRVLVTKPSGTGIPRGWGIKLKNLPWGRYGYFLELHNLPHRLTTSGIISSKPTQASHPNNISSNAMQASYTGIEPYKIFHHASTQHKGYSTHQFVPAKTKGL